jgi:two-component system cell cycle response regulator
MSNDHASILIVDDDPINRTLLSHTLVRHGHSTRMVENGHQALEILAAEAFDVVLLDVVMPGIDGYEVLKSLKDNSKRRHIPVIMISALDEIDSVIRCIEMGAEDYLLKPFDPMLLRARINSGLARKRLHDLELEYFEQVGHVVDAAAQVENGTFSSESLDEVATRQDALGRLGRVFQQMAREVQERERRLKREVQKLRIEIDETTAARQVAEITETDYFQDLQTKADELRAQTNS